MKAFFCIIAVMCLMDLTAVCSAEPKELPRLEAKPYLIGIAPSHLIVPPNPLFESDAEWTQVAKEANLYKYYGVQLMEELKWTNHIDPKALVDFTKKHDMKIACEFGDFHLGTEDIPDATILAFRQLDPIYEAGGDVYSLHLDGPVRRMIKGFQKDPTAISLDEISVKMVDFWQKIHAKYPRIRIGLTTNFPNWDYTKELPGYNGDYTDQSGVTYLQALNTLHQALTEAGEKIDFVEVDCPYNYYREKRTRNNDADVDNARKFIELHQWCQERDIQFKIIVNAEPRGEGAQGFHDLTGEYVEQLRQDGIFPDVFTIQSWYEEPAKNLPETEKYTFMNTAKDAIDLIQKLYPNKKPE